MGAGGAQISSGVHDLDRIARRCRGAAMRVVARASRWRSIWEGRCRALSASVAGMGVVGPLEFSVAQVGHTCKSHVVELPNGLPVGITPFPSTDWALSCEPSVCSRPDTVARISKPGVALTG